MSCEGTVYLKLPEGWTSAYAIADGNMVAFEKSDYDGWLSIQVSAIGGRNDADGFNINESAEFLCGENGHCITPTSMNVPDMTINEKTGFTCADLAETGELWISANPDSTKSTEPYYGSNPPGGKFFYVFLPNTREWLTSVPMITADGGKTSEALIPDPERFGWYFKRFFDEEPPSNVIIFRDDDKALDDAIGIGGDWDESASPTPIDLETLFDFYGSDSLFFVATSEFLDMSQQDAMGWSTSAPEGVEGGWGFYLASTIYDTDASLHGAFTCAPYWFDGQTEEQAMYNACYYDEAKYPVATSGNNVVPCVGVTQGMVAETLPDDKKPILTDLGKKCFGSQADEAFAAMFNSTPGVNETYCVDIPFYRGNDGLYEFDSDDYQSRGAPVPGGFYPAEEPPSKENMMSDYLPAAESKRMAEGPVFMCADYNNLTTMSPEGFRTIDKNEGVPVSDLICNGPGWDGGVDCAGFFVGGSEFASFSGVVTSIGREIQQKFNMTFTGDGWSWSCPNEAPIGWHFYEEGSEKVVATKTSKKGYARGGISRWTSGSSDSEILTSKGRNQHYCLEAHAKFRYKKGLRFSFRGDGDTWVYLDNKLAADIGGAHLPAPGYVDLDKFVGASAAWTVGDLYDIDIYYCNRRTTTNSLRIKTNMFVEQAGGLSKQVVSKEKGVESYLLGYYKDSDGSCASRNATNPVVDGLCAYLASAGKTIDYNVITSKGDLVSSAKEMAKDTVYFGGIDLTDRCSPKLDKNKITGLTPDTYYLVASIEGKTQKFQFTVEKDSSSTVIKDSSDTKNPVAKDTNGTKISTKDTSKKKEAIPGSEPFLASNFRIIPAGNATFDIILESADKGKPFAVMDMMGSIVQQGYAAPGATRVTVKNHGVYIVRVGYEYQKTNLK